MSEYLAIVPAIVIFAFVFGAIGHWYFVRRHASNQESGSE